MTRQIRGNSRRVAAAVMAAATSLTAVTLTSLPTSADAAPVTAAGTAATASSGRYVAISHTGRTYRLQLVDSASGKVVRTLATRTVADLDAQPFWSADLAADGSVYVVQRRAGTKGVLLQYGGDLVRYRNGRATVVARWIDSVRVSPDGRTVAVALDTPYGPKKGHGLKAVRTITPTGRTLRTLNTTVFPKDASGAPAVEPGGQWIQGWVGNGSIILGRGCCSDSDTFLVPVAKATPQRTWPFFDGTDNAMAVGTRRSSALVLRPYFVAVGPHQDKQVGYEVAWLNALRPKGQIVERIRTEDSAEKVGARMNTKYGAVPIFATPTTFPFKGTGTLVEAGI